MSPKDYEQFKVDGLNNTVGDRNLEDGYECKVCKNKGTIYKVIDYGDGTYSHCATDCKCAEIRRSILRMKRSGLKDIIKDYTFDKFLDTEPWQKAIKEAAMEYAENPEGWFALCGQSGSGKTHLCTAICREFLLSGKKVVYMLWRDEIVRIKEAAQSGDSSLQEILEKYKTADVLYIDDLFKTGKDKFNEVVKPSVADINYAFEIINYRYNNPKLMTIISSELSEEELLDIDEAIGGRIYERAKTFTIAKSRDRNYRIRKAVTL
jgi:DNA replication protein DnaC